LKSAKNYGFYTCISTHLKKNVWTLFGAFFSFLCPKKTIFWAGRHENKKIPLLLWSQKSFANPNSVIRPGKSKKSKNRLPLLCRIVALCTCTAEDKVGEPRYEYSTFQTK
jgi:hypothetical protein